MNKNALKSRKAILFAVLVIVAIAPAFVQGSGAVGISETTSIVSSYFDPRARLVYAIDAIAGSIGGAEVYGKFSSSDPDISRTTTS